MTPITLELLAIENQVAPDDVAIVTIAAGPKPVTQDDHSGISRFRVLIPKARPRVGLTPKSVKNCEEAMVARMRSGCSPPETLACQPRMQAMTEKTEFCAAQSIKFAGEASWVETPVSDALRNCDNAFGIGIGERVEQDRVDHAEDGSAGGNPEPECHDRDKSEGRKTLRS